MYVDAAKKRAAAGRPRDLPLPASAYQVRPLLGQLDTHPEAAIEMWKAACSRAGKGNVPTFDQVQRAALDYKAIEANEARRLSAAQQTVLNKATAASQAARADYKPDLYKAIREEQKIRDRRGGPEPVRLSVPAWEIQKDDSSVDAAEECKRITRAINDAHKAIGLLRGILYSQINKYGSDYMGFLRQVDAGVYSLSNIDDQLQQMGEDVRFIADLLVADVGEGELAQATVDVDSFPTRE